MQSRRLGQKYEFITGNHVNKVTPTLDCIPRFIDDLYEQTTQETLAECYSESMEDLWIGTDAHINNEKVITMNVIKQQLASTLLGAQRMILQNYPTAREAAVYKKCPSCGAVYTKPTWCNYVGRCGGRGVPKDASHNGSMALQFKYDYDAKNKE